MITPEQIVEAAVDWACDRTFYFVHGRPIQDDDVTARLNQLVGDYMEENKIER